MLNHSAVDKTRVRKRNTQGAQLTAFRQTFDEHYQLLCQMLTTENALLVMLVHAYVAYKYQPLKKLKQENTITKKPVTARSRFRNSDTVEISILEVPRIECIFNSVENPLLLNLNEKIDQIVCLFFSKDDIDETANKLIQLLNAANYGFIQKSFIRLRKTYSHKKDYAQAIFPIFSSYLAALSAKKQWGDSSAISSLYQVIIGDISNLTLYDGASGLGNTSLRFSPAKLIMREKQCTPALLNTLLFEMLGYDFNIRVLDSLTAKNSSHQADISICSPNYGVEIQPLWLIGSQYLQSLDVAHPIPSSASDSLWVQHCLYHLNDKGKAYLILPIGWLFKGGYDLAVREALVHRNLIECVTVLPMAMRQYNQINACLVILNKAKTTEKVWLINAENFGMEREYGGDITQKSIDALGKLIADPQEDKFSILVGVSQISENKYDLNPTRYFLNPLGMVTLELTKELQALKKYQQTYEMEKVRLEKLLSSLV